MLEKFKLSKAKQLKNAIQLVELLETQGLSIESIKKIIHLYGVETKIN